MRSDAVSVAVDVGGTGIKCALIDRSGRVRHSERHPTQRERGPDSVVATVLEVSARLAARAIELRHAPVAAAIAIPGIVNDEAGTVEWSANLGLRSVPLRALVHDRLALPVAVGHDVRAGALAEARLGAGRDARRMLFVAIGTGIAGGYVIDKRIDPGAHGAAGELGHVTIRSGPQARKCACGGHGCLEAYASASAVAAAYAETLGGAPYTSESVNRVPFLSAEGVVGRAEAGDAAAGAVWADAVAALADGLLTAMALLDPDTIVLGGGLAEAGPLLLDPLATALTERRTFHRLPRLSRAELGDMAGCHGAALLAFALAGGGP